MRVITSILFLLMMACVDPLNVKLTSEERHLVVDGLITDQPGPYQVTLSYYSNTLNPITHLQFEPVTSAQVFIVDDQQHKVKLIEKAPGIYVTLDNELTGEINKGYSLSIQTTEGDVYQSSLQRMTHPGEINNIYFEFYKEPRPGFTDGLQVYIDSKGVLDENNLFRWRWTTIHKTKTNPEFKIEYVPPRAVERPAPEPCSGYIYQGGRLVRVGECTCCFCWSYNYSEGAFVSHNDFVSDNQFNKQHLGLIPVTAMHFFDRYYIEVQQLSLSEEAYDFWNLVEKQQKGATDIFQPNAIKIRGNITSVTNPNEEVLGFFGVSAVARKSLYINENEVPYALPAIDLVPFSCLDYYENPTTEKPFFW